MKKRIKNIMLIILGGIIFTSIGVIGSNVITANQVGYTSSKTTKTNMQDAIDELYDKAKNHCPEGMYCTSSIPGYTSNGLLLLYDGLHAPINGRWVDLTGNGNDGTLNNFSNNAWSNNGIQFDGVDDYISVNPISTFPSGNSQYTMEIYIYILLN